jgi:hypothetical protein
MAVGRTEVAKRSQRAVAPGGAEEPAEPGLSTAMEDDVDVTVLITAYDEGPLLLEAAGAIRCHNGATITDGRRKGGSSGTADG